MFRTPLALFRTLAVAEAISWTLLITGLILRATTDVDIAVTIGGASTDSSFWPMGRPPC